MADLTNVSRALACAIAVSAVGIWRVGVIPIETPLPQPLDRAVLDQLQDQGWQLQSTVAAQARQRVSSAEGYTLTNSSSFAGQQVRLSLIPIRARGVDDLGVVSFERAISGQGPAKPSTITIDGDAWLRFRGSGQDQLAASCVAGSSAQSSRDHLARLLSTAPTSWLERARILVGQQHPRNFSCLYITIAIGNQRHPEAVIKQVWLAVKPDVMQRG